MNASLTATAIEKMRQRAKQQARERAIPYSHALEDEAKSAGFASWHDVRRAARPPAPPAAPQSADLPVDPLLPPRFDDTPNERRSKAELDAWWLRDLVMHLFTLKFKPAIAFSRIALSKPCG